MSVWGEGSRAEGSHYRPSAMHATCSGMAALESQNRKEDADVSTLCSFLNPYLPGPFAWVGRNVTRPLRTRCRDGFDSVAGYSDSLSLSSLGLP